MIIEFMDSLGEGGSLKRSLGMACPEFTISKAFSFEAATQLQANNQQIYA
jgi:hypothetical protein